MNPSRTLLSHLAILAALAGCTPAPTPEVPPPLSNEPALTLRTGATPAAVYQVYLDQQGLIRRLETANVSTPEQRTVLDLTRTGDRIEGALVDAAETSAPFAVTWKNGVVELAVKGSVTKSVTVGNEPLLLWRTDKVSAWGDENSYQEIPVYPSYDARAEPSLYRWYGLYLREKHLADDEVYYQLGPLKAGYQLTTNHREDPEHAWIPGAVTTAEGSGLHSADRQTNVVNQVILNHVTGKGLLFLPSVWGWSPLK